ncbi:RepB family plasmid replication initiator protein [Aerococcus urinaeequi]|uniref:RepB family plasmid replication initiator protein n=1 Tax=Aerococcus urinaeequi TaxID=51665 RepID=UPI003ADE8459
MKNEVVKYHNDLNTVSMRNWSAEEMNFFFTIISKVRDNGTEQLEFNTDELKDLAQFADNHRQRWVDTMTNTADKISQLTYIERTTERISIMTLFQRFDIYPEGQRMTVQVSPNFDYIVNRISVGFTTYELAEFTQIRSTYAKSIYRLLKQWRTIGRKEFKIEDLKRLLDMPDYYGPSEIDKNVLKPVRKELPVYFDNLKIKKVKANTRGTPVTGYIFTWKPEQTEPWLENKYDDQPQEYAPKYEDKFTEWLIYYGVLSAHDYELIEQFKLEVYPIYQQLADRATLDTVEKHISYVAKQNYTHPVGYFKKAAKDYLKRFF